MNDLDLDKIAAAALACQTRDAHSLLRVARTGGVRQQGDTLRDEVQNVVDAAQCCAAQRQRDDLCTGVLHGSLDEVHRVFAGAENEAGGKFVSAEGKGIVFHHKSPFFLLCIKNRKISDYAD